MSVGIRLGIVGAALLLGGLMAGIPSGAQAQQAAIGGQVVDEAAGTPLEAAGSFSPEPARSKPRTVMGVSSFARLPRVPIR